LTGSPLLLHKESGIIPTVAHSINSDVMSAVAYSPNGGRLATANRALGVTLWKAVSVEREHTWPGSTGTWNVDGRVAFSPDGTLVAAASEAGPVRLWDVATGERIAELSGHEGGSGDVAFAPGGATLASTGLDGSIRLWDVATTKAMAVLGGQPTAKVNRVAFSPDGSLIASGSDDATIRLWDSRSHAALSTIYVGSKVYGVAFSPDGTRLALGCADTIVRLIDVATRQEVAGLRGHTDFVHAVAWSPDSTRLVSGSGDHTVRVWDSLSIEARARASQPRRGFVSSAEAPTSRSTSLQACRGTPAVGLRLERIGEPQRKQPLGRRGAHSVDFAGITTPGQIMPPPAQIALKL
jgi:WD40 repeat protein